MGRYTNDKTKGGHPGGGNGKFKDDFGKGEYIPASDDGDHLMGDDGSNYIDGLEGRDNLLGFKGSDLVVGGLDADNISGGDDADVLVGGQIFANYLPGGRDDPTPGDVTDDPFFATADGAVDTFNIGDGVCDLDEDETYAADTIRALELTDLDDEDGGTGDIIDVKDIDCFNFSDALVVPETSDPLGSEEDSVDGDELASYIWVTEDGDLVIDLDGANDGDTDEDDIVIATIATTADLDVNGGNETFIGGTEDYTGVTICIDLPSIVASYDDAGDFAGVLDGPDTSTLAVWNEANENWDILG